MNLVVKSSRWISNKASEKEEKLRYCRYESVWRMKWLSSWTRHGGHYFHYSKSFRYYGCIVEVGGWFVRLPRGNGQLFVAVKQIILKGNLLTLTLQGYHPSEFCKIHTIINCSFWYPVSHYFMIVEIQMYCKSEKITNYFSFHIFSGANTHFVNTQRLKAWVFAFTCITSALLECYGV